MIYTINLDWLQVYCQGDEICTDEIRYGNTTFRVELTGKETIQFKKLYYIYIGEQKVAEIQQVPRTKIIKPRATIVKLENQILYCNQYVQILHQIIKACKLQFKGLTRVDVALDCQELADHQSVEALLQDTIRLRETEEGFIYNSAYCHSTYHVQLSNKAGSRITGAKWGSPRSAVNVYCYDKTLELIEKKDKPWIRDVWQMNGIDYLYSDDELAAMTNKQKKKLARRTGLQDYVKKPVWRFEISIKAEGKDCIRLETGEIFTLSLNDLANNQGVRELFISYAEKYFDFRKNTGQENRRYFDKVKIFDFNETPTLRRVTYRECQETGRSEKICYNKLAKLRDQVGGEEDGLKWHIKEVMQHLRERAEMKKYLFMERKYLQTDLSNLDWRKEKTQMWYELEWISAERRRIYQGEPNSEELRMFSPAIPEVLRYDDPESGTYWKTLLDSCSLMQAPEIVIPEGAKRLSHDFAQIV